jgi:hypothetical protein
LGAAVCHPHGLEGGGGVELAACAQTRAAPRIGQRLAERLQPAELLACGCGVGPADGRRAIERALAARPPPKASKTRSLSSYSRSQKCHVPPLPLRMAVGGSCAKNRAVAATFPTVTRRDDDRVAILPSPPPFARAGDGAKSSDGPVGALPSATVAGTARRLEAKGSAPCLRSATTFDASSTFASAASLRFAPTRQLRRPPPPQGGPPPPQPPRPEAPSSRAFSKAGGHLQARGGAGRCERRRVRRRVRRGGLEWRIFGRRRFFLLIF